MKLVVGILLLAGCGRIGFADRTGPADAGSGDGPAPCAWSAPVAVMGGVNTNINDWEPTLSLDRKTLVFARAVDLMSATHLFLAKRTQDTGPFGPATMVLSSANSEGGALWTRNGSELYFVSDRLVLGDARLWSTTYDASLGTFANPKQIMELAGEPMVGPALSPDGLELFYSDNLPLMGKLRHATRATLISPWVVEGVVTDLDNGATQGFATLTPDGKTLYLESAFMCTGGCIYMATRRAIGAAFGPLTKADAFNAGSTESGDPELTPDGTMMIYAAARPGNAGLQDIYTQTCM